VRDSAINPRREPPSASADLNTQLYRAYLAGDGDAVERIMALIQAGETPSTDPVKV
jgi:hypothetical protein